MDLTRIQYQNIRKSPNEAGYGYSLISMPSVFLLLLLLSEQAFCTTTTATKCKLSDTVDYDAAWWFSLDAGETSDFGKLRYVLDETQTAFSVQKDVYTNPVDAIIVPSTITIDPVHCKDIPVTVVMNSAFVSCILLTEITFGEGLTKVDAFAFARCEKLTTVNLPTTVTEIGKQAFYMSGLERFQFPEKVTSLSFGVLDECESLQQVVMTGDMSSYAQYAFDNTAKFEVLVYLGKTITDDFDPFDCREGVTCKRPALVLDEVVKETDELFYYKVKDYPIRYMLSLSDGNDGKTNKITVVNSGDVTISGIHTGFGVPRDGIEEVVLDANVVLKEIGDSAFSGFKKLAKFAVPVTVTRVGDSAFEGCLGLTTVTFEEPSIVSEIGAHAFDGSGIVSMELPDSVTKIGEYAFANAEALNKITFPVNLDDIGKYAFTKTVLLEEISLPKGLSSIEEGLFQCGSLRKIALPVGVSKVGAYAFANMTSLEAVTGGAVEIIGDYAFAYTEFLTTVETSSVKEIGDYAFAYSVSLNEVDFGNVLTLGKGVFAFAFSSDPVTLEMGRLETAEEGVFEEAAELQSVSLLTATMENIPDRMFAGAAGLRSVELPSKVRTIGERGFEGCASLTVMAFPDDLTSVGKYAFKDSRLEELVLPAGFESIGEGAFESCTSLLLVHMRGIEKVGSGAFAKCTALAEVFICVIPTELSVDYEVDPFEGCVMLDVIHLPYGFEGESVTGIEKELVVALDGPSCALADPPTEEPAESGTSTGVIVGAVVGVVVVVIVVIIVVVLIFRSANKEADQEDVEPTGEDDAQAQDEAHADQDEVLDEPSRKGHW